MNSFFHVLFQRLYPFRNARSRKSAQDPADKLHVLSGQGGIEREQQAAPQKRFGVGEMPGGRSAPAPDGYHGVLECRFGLNAPLGRVLSDLASSVLHQNGKSEIDPLPGPQHRPGGSPAPRDAAVPRDPGVRGDTATGGTKPATLETGAVVKVPLFVNTGDKIKIDTRTGTYVSRA